MIEDDGLSQIEGECKKLLSNAIDTITFLEELIPSI